MMERFYSEFQQLPQEQQEMIKAIMSIMKSDKDLNLKTDINNPSLHSALDLLAVYFKDIDQNLASKYITFYSKSLKEQMVSNKREGRKEFTEMMSLGLQSLVNRGRDFGDRLTGRGKE